MEHRKALHWNGNFAAVGVEVVYFPYTLDTSSTLLRAALEKSVNSRQTGTE